MQIVSNEEGKLKNTVSIRLCDTQGNVLDTREMHNLVVITGRQLVCRLLAGETTKYLAKMAMGHDAVEIAGTKNVVPADNEDTGIGNPIRVENITHYTYPSRTSVTFYASFYREHVLAYINELRMLTADNVLYARLTFPEIDMTSEAITALAEVVWTVRY